MRINVNDAADFNNLRRSLEGSRRNRRRRRLNIDVGVSIVFNVDSDEGVTFFNNADFHIGRVNMALSQKEVEMVSLGLWEKHQLSWLKMFYGLKVQRLVFHTKSSDNIYDEKDCLRFFEMVKNILLESLSLKLFTKNLNKGFMETLIKSMELLNDNLTHTDCSLYISKTEDIQRCGLNDTAFVQGLSFSEIDLKFNKEVKLSKEFQCKLSCMMIRKLNLHLTAEYRNMVLMFLCRGCWVSFKVKFNDVTDISSVLPLFLVPVEKNKVTNIEVNDARVTRVQFKAVIKYYKQFSFVEDDTENQLPPVTELEQKFLRMNYTRTRGRYYYH